MVGNKRRKGWFMGVIMISLVFTILSGGYLFSQLHYSKDVSLVAPDDLSGDSSDQSKVPFGRGTAPTGPRRNRGKGKGKGGKGNGTVKDTAAPAPQKDQEDVGKTDHDPVDDHGSELNLSKGGAATTADQVTRICDLEDVSNGQWIFTTTPSHPFATAEGEEQDMIWTGYGKSGCSSNIWNERYLLTPTPGSTNGTLGGSSLSIGQKQSKKDWDYATRLKAYHWQLNQPIPGNKAPKSVNDQEKCQQPIMDVVDFVEVLKRAPLVMIGDRFLEQEYLALECIILGMQTELILDYKRKHPEEQSDVGGKNYPRDYSIESEKPEIVELQIGRVGSAEGSGMYRKAKPGQMRLVDRLSNLTLATFIRSDVLWDSNMLQRQVSKHALKSAAELSKLDVGGLHPDCQLVGKVVLCEPANIRSHDIEPEQPAQSSSWWSWWIGTENPTQEQTQDSVLDKNGPEEEMTYGSDLDHDMINLEWTEMLPEFLPLPQGEHKDEASARTPLVLISNGLFWEYDSWDAMTAAELAQMQDHKKLSKSEQEHLRRRQIRRKKMLRQRYTMILTNTLDYLQAVHPELRVMVQTSVKRRPCEPLQGSMEAADKALRDSKDQEAALLNALTKTVVAKMRDERFSFLDTTFLRLFQDSPTANKRYCRNFMMPGPLDILIHHLYGELYRLDL
ncbi:hypothetical protein EMPS_08153 [Entomortierella parvispora]|uniref:Uncharacterized protein n=1 Tax=Entomortierella parvispora TaxID=205924 RepID=A0A9P3HFH5_9FUNG|nr:hypothetical protein EMPS_08153 [Entomortierella parvispora]